MIRLRMVGMEQVHGDDVVRVSKNDDGKIVKNCDGLISNDPAVTLSVRVADCLPISIVDRKSRSFGLIHAGWRGLDKEIIEKTIRLMIKEFSSDPKDFEVSIGPHICVKHYEVKKDVSKKFGEYSLALLVVDGKIYLDLAKVAEFQLIESGVKKKNIKISKLCTFEDGRLHSFRRDQTLDRDLYFLHLAGVE